MVRVSHLTENRKVASIGVCSFVATVTLDYSSSVDHGGDSVEFKSLCHERLLSLVMASNCLPSTHPKTCSPASLMPGVSAAMHSCLPQWRSRTLLPWSCPGPCLPWKITPPAPSTQPPTQPSGRMLPACPMSNLPFLFSVFHLCCQLMWYLQTQVKVDSRVIDQRDKHQQLNKTAYKYPVLCVTFNTGLATNSHVKAKYRCM